MENSFMMMTTSSCANCCSPLLVPNSLSPEYTLVNNHKNKIRNILSDKSPCFETENVEPIIFEINIPVSDHPIDYDGGGSSRIPNDSCIQIKDALSDLYKFDYLTVLQNCHQNVQEEAEDEGQAEENVGICQKCSTVFQTLYQSFNEFSNLRRLDSYLSRRISRLEQIVQKFQVSQQPNLNHHPVVTKEEKENYDSTPEHEDVDNFENVMDDHYQMDDDHDANANLNGMDDDDDDGAANLNGMSDDTSLIELKPSVPNSDQSQSSSSSPHPPSPLQEKGPWVHLQRLSEEEIATATSKKISSKSLPPKRIIKRRKRKCLPAPGTGILWNQLCIRTGDDGDWKKGSYLCKICKKTYSTYSKIRSHIRAWKCQKAEGVPDGQEIGTATSENGVDDHPPPPPLPSTYPPPKKIIRRRKRKCLPAPGTGILWNELCIRTGDHEEDWRKGSFLCKICKKTYSNYAAIRSHIRAWNCQKAEVGPDGQEIGTATSENCVDDHPPPPLPSTYPPPKKIIRRRKRKCLPAPGTGILWNELCIRTGDHEEDCRKGSFLCKICKKTYSNYAAIRAHIRALHCQQQQPAVPHGQDQKERDGHPPPASKSPPTIPENGVDHPPPPALPSKSPPTKRILRRRKRKCRPAPGTGILWNQLCVRMDDGPDSHKGSFLCKVCKKIYATHSGIRLHIRAWHCQETEGGPDGPGQQVVRERLFKCTQSHCGRTFLTQQGLKIHSDGHSGQTYVCPICRKQFTTSSSVLVHKRMVHDQEKPFLCSECGGKFASTGSLRNHQKLHQQEKSYACEICGRAYKQLPRLHSHRQTHGPRTILCALCGKAFHTKQKLKRHYRQVHPGEVLK